MTERLFDRQVREHAETERRRKEYDEQERQRAEQRRIEGEREELENHLRRRGERYVETTGQPPSMAVLSSWREEYVNEKEAAARADRERRIEATKNQIF